MKTYVLFAMLLLSHCLIHSSAKIINGYSLEIISAKASLTHLLALPQDRNVMVRLERVKSFILYYHLTEQLLQHFKEIAPELYHKIDTIRDFSGRTVDVYVRFVPAVDIEPGTKATTNLNQAGNDKHAYFSTYGPLTVSVKVITAPSSLLILAHEFGHVFYQVPHLVEYIQFFKRTYTDYHMKADYLGHKPNDPSGQSADLFEKAFRMARANQYKRTRPDLPNPVLLRQKIAKAMP